MQPENKNDGVQLSTRYEQYVFAKRHLRGTPRPQVFPFGEGNQNDIDQLNQPTHSNDRIYGIEGIAPTLNTMQGGRRQPKIAPTIRANHHNTADVHFIPDDSKIRRLTPTECERLQGFPDGWTKYGGHKKAADIISKNPEHGDAFEIISDTQRYKTLGNAITTFVIEDIMVRLLNE
jgi:site-specific DNA-cytosine methylase